MIDGRDLHFPEQAEGYVFDREVVGFWGQDGVTRVRCEISEEALRDHFDGDGKDLLDLFRANRRVIEREARRRYLAGRIEPDGSVLIRSSDF